MKYSKPEVAVLGDALNVIEDTLEKSGSVSDAPPVNSTINPAYDLDE